MTTDIDALTLKDLDELERELDALELHEAERREEDIPTCLKAPSERTWKMYLKGFYDSFEGEMTRNIKGYLELRTILFYEVARCRKVAEAGERGFLARRQKMLERVARLDAFVEEKVDKYFHGERQTRVKFNRLENDLRSRIAVEKAEPDVTICVSGCSTYTFSCEELEDKLKHARFWEDKNPVYAGYKFAGCLWDKIMLKSLDEIQYKSIITAADEELPCTVGYSYFPENDINSPKYRARHLIKYKFEDTFKSLFWDEDYRDDMKDALDEFLQYRKIK